MLRKEVLKAPWTCCRHLVCDRGPHCIGRCIAQARAVVFWANRRGHLRELVKRLCPGLCCWLAESGLSCGLIISFAVSVLPRLALLQPVKIKPRLTGVQAIF